MSALVETSRPAESSQVVEPQVVSTPSEMLPLSAERKSIFLSTLVTTGGNITRAADLIGMSRQNVLRWVQTDPVFAELFHDAIEAGTDHLEEAAYNRAMSNSDRIMEFLLRARRPERYRDPARNEADLELDVNALASLLRAVCERARQLQVDQTGQLDHVGQVAAIGDGHSESSAVIDVVPVGHVDQTTQLPVSVASGLSGPTPIVTSGSGQSSSPVIATTSNRPAPATKRHYHT